MKPQNIVVEWGYELEHTWGMWSFTMHGYNREHELITADIWHRRQFIMIIGKMLKLWVTGELEQKRLAYITKGV
jgi:hypothetical protein